MDLDEFEIPGTGVVVKDEIFQKQPDEPAAASTIPIAETDHS